MNSTDRHRDDNSQKRRTAGHGRSTSQGYARRAYQQTREDLDAHRRVRSDAARYSAQSARYKTHSRQAKGSGASVASSKKRKATTGRHSVATPRKARFQGISPKLIGALALVIVIGVGVLWFHPFGIGASGGSAGNGSSIVDANSATVTTDDKLPTPIMAQSEGVELHCAVSADDLTEILIHNASYSYACPITTELTEATNATVKANGGTGRDANAQPTGDEWLTGEFIRTFRSNNAGPKMSAIDCGGAVGTQVYAPVSGTVLLVKKYKLYDKYDDYQIHIRPEGHDDLDVVLIHLTDPSVKAGDTVQGGVTPLAKIRDVYAYIGESMQLKKYTADGDNGNHTHIQVNDVTAKNYHGLDDLKKS